MTFCEPSTLLLQACTPGWRAAGFEVDCRRDHASLWVNSDLEQWLLPHLESQLDQVLGEAAGVFFHLWRNRLIAQLHDGEITVVLDYWRPAQFLLHGTTTFIFFLQLPLAVRRIDLLLWFALANLAIYLSVQLELFSARRKARSVPMRILERGADL